VALVCAILQIYTLVIVARAIASFFPINSSSRAAPIVGLLHQLTDPVFLPLRRVIPAVGMLDFTPLVVIIAIQIIASVLGC